MARPRQGRETRERLIEAGVDAFLLGGYHGTGIKEVLDRVHVPKGSFYNYFESKEDFAVAAIRHYSECFVARMDAEVARASDPLTGFRAFLVGLMQDWDENGYVGGCLIWNLGAELEGSDVCRTALQEGFRGWRDRVAEVFAEAQKHGLVRQDKGAAELADLFTVAWEGAVIRMKIEKSLEPLQAVTSHFLDDYLVP